MVVGRFDGGAAVNVVEVVEKELVPGAGEECRAFAVVGLEGDFLRLVEHFFGVGHPLLDVVAGGVAAGGMMGEFASENGQVTATVKYGKVFVQRAELQRNVLADVQQNLEVLVVDAASVVAQSE